MPVRVDRCACAAVVVMAVAPIKVAADPASPTVAADGKTASPTVAAVPPTPLAAAMSAAGTGPHSIAFGDRPAPIRVCVFGGGSFGTAMAQVLARNGHKVTI